MTARNGSQRLSGPGLWSGPGGSVASDPGIGLLAGFAPTIASGTGSDPGIGFVAGFASAGGAWTYRATVSRSIPSSWAIRRWDQPSPWSVNIACTTAILSWFAMPNLPKPKSDRFREVSTANRRLLKVAGFEPDPSGWVYPILDTQYALLAARKEVMPMDR